ncbi:MAG TPA: dihydrolipoamide acetyltransferase family protein [Leptolinea sp.]
MAFEVKLPRLGWDMEEGSLGEWLKKDGDLVNSGEMLFSVEGDKAVQEIESMDSGILKVLPGGPQPGQKVPIGTLLGYLVSEEELKTFIFPELSQTGVSQSSSLEVIEADLTNLEQPAIENQVQSETASISHRVYISPFAKRLAEGLGVDWQVVQGSGLRGRIMSSDIRKAADNKISVGIPGIPARYPESAMPVQKTAPPPVLTDNRQPMTQIRRKIAEHLAYSAHTAAAVTLTAEVDATELVKLRNGLKKDVAGSGFPVPSYTDLLVKMSSQALLEYPIVNARIEGDEIVQSAAIHIAVAVDTERGLIVPVVKNVQNKSLRQIVFESAQLIEKARNGQINYDDLQGATFTITNLGMFEIDAFTPIIDLPQCAVLGVGRIAPRQMVIDFEKEIVAIRQVMILSLTFDHRLIDGAQAGRFLQRLKRFVENPYLWIVG